MSLVLAPIAYWHWLALGGVLVIVEAFAPGFLFVWLGFAALAVGLALLVWPSLGLSLQLLLFAVLAVASMFAWRYWQGSRTPTSDHPHLNRRGEQYVGRRAVITDPIVNGRGRAKLGDTSWQVSGPDLPAGRVVEIVGLEERSSRSSRQRAERTTATRSQRHPRMRRRRPGKGSDRRPRRRRSHDWRAGNRGRPATWQVLADGLPLAPDFCLVPAGRQDQTASRGVEP